MPTLPSISPEPPPAENPAARASPALARLVVGVLLVIVPIMIGSICWRWATVHGPTAAVIVRGDASLEGAIISVRGSGKTYTLDLDRDNNWQTPVLLDPGVYHIEVAHHGRNILDTNFSLESLHGISYDLPSMIVLTGSLALNDAQIEVTRVSGDRTPFAAMEVKLDDHFRTSKYLPPGTYRLTARNIVSPHRVLAQVEFTVEHTGSLPLHVDLAKAAEEGEK
jgi:hypothetical protein